MSAGGGADPTARDALLSVCGLLAFGMAVGFLVLPGGRHGGFDPWGRICRAVGLGGPPGADGPVIRSPPVSTVAWTMTEVARATGGDSVRGGGIALTCDGCHGTKATRAMTLFPSLAGMDSLSFTKQMADYANGLRINPVMQAFGMALTPGQVADVAAFYAAQEPTPPGGPGVSRDAERLISRGSEARGMAPCASCHGSNNRSPGMARLNGVSADYLAAQLLAWRSGLRRNDPYDVMGSIARSMTPAEVREVAAAYAGGGPGI